ncbi:alpha/beta fold hydrolase [Cucumibacter marinus]|uniref:alpha/beta fold hydrolase n=1 Tax=Cucumibacter marinus TaxID=1121252 RepID=UPI0003FB7E7A|nr:alpha/beta hydrolase [Cucumibacter marinus]
MNALTSRRGRTVRLLITLAMVIVVIIGLFAALATYQSMAARAELAALERPGSIIEIEGREVYVDCRGDAQAGRPTVLIETGNGSLSTEWRPIQQQLSATHRVCVYDRAGYGQSDAGKMPRDADQAVSELRALVEALSLGPVILVGHSLGGWHAELYALRYPEDVAGLILVDSPAPDLGSNPDFVAGLQGSIGFYTVMKTVIGSGIMRVLAPIAGDQALPPVAAALPELSDEYMTLVQRSAHWDSAIAEIEAVTESTQEVLDAREGDYPLGDLPLIMLSAEPAGDDAVAAAIFASQERQAALSTRGERVVVPETGHNMHIDAPQAIISAVEEISDRVGR